MYVCLRDFRNVGDTAADPSVHRNTVTYRVRRAEELFGFDSSDNAAMNDLRLALSIMVAEGRLLP